MTNAEKFKEIFDIEIVPENTCLSESCLCHECSHHDGTRCHVEDWWYAEYQGKPTIPLSVIEKIHDAIDNADSDGDIEDDNGNYIGSVLTDYHVHEIIDKAVKEIKHDNSLLHIVLYM